MIKELDTSTTVSELQLQILPEQVLVGICKMLNLHEVKKISETCKRFNDVFEKYYLSMFSTSIIYRRFDFSKGEDEHFDEYIKFNPYPRVGSTARKSVPVADIDKFRDQNTYVGRQFIRYLVKEKCDAIQEIMQHQDSLSELTFRHCKMDFELWIGLHKILKKVKTLEFLNGSLTINGKDVVKDFKIKVIERFYEKMSLVRIEFQTRVVDEAILKKIYVFLKSFKHPVTSLSIINCPSHFFPKSADMQLTYLQICDIEKVDDLIPFIKIQKELRTVRIMPTKDTDHAAMDSLLHSCFQSEKVRELTLGFPEFFSHEFKPTMIYGLMTQFFFRVDKNNKVFEDEVMAYYFLSMILNSMIHLEELHLDLKMKFEAAQGRHMNDLTHLKKLELFSGVQQSFLKELSLPELEDLHLVFEDKFFFTSDSIWQGFLTDNKRLRFIKIYNLIPSENVINAIKKTLKHFDYVDFKVPCTCPAHYANKILTILHNDRNLVLTTVNPLYKIYKFHYMINY